MGFPEWVSDGSPEISIISPNQVECTKDSSTGNVFNALWKESAEGNGNGIHYWQVTFTDFSDSPWIGLTDLSKFQKGWAMKGLMFGGPGNLSNGGALLVGSYGPGIEKSGDTVGMLVQLDEAKIKIYFDLNGQQLGLAFEVLRTVLDSQLFPVVHFSGQCKAEIRRVTDTIPQHLDRTEPSFEGIEGNWKLESYNGNAPIHSSVMQIKKLEQKGEQTSYSVFLHVLNNISFQMKHDGTKGTWITGDNRISTLMGGCPEDMKFESEVNGLTTNPSKVEIGPDEVLLVVKGDVESKWIRYSTAKDPITADPFN